MEQDIVRTSVERSWADEVLPSLSGLVTIPALSPAFDAQWDEHGQLQAAVNHVEAWIGTRGLRGATSEVVELPGRSPLLLVDVPATAGAADRGTVLLYGHLDKQPEFTGWLPISLMAWPNSGCWPMKAPIFAGSGLPVVWSGAEATSRSRKPATEFTTNTGMLFIPVRHSSPLGNWNSNARLRTAWGASARYGCPTASAKRPITGTRPARNTAALDNATPRPLLSK